MTQELTTKENFELAAENFDVAMKHFEGKSFSTLNGAMVDLLKEASRETHRLLAVLGNLTLVSLSVRNLFELFLISKHIYSDDKALSAWYGQAHKDSKDVKDAFIKLMEKKGLDPADLVAIQEFEDESLAQSPFESKGNFQARDLAEKYGYLDDYKFIYKLSSKLIHPSSMKVMTHSSLSIDSNYLNVILHIGVYFGQKFSLFLKKVLEEDT